MWRWGWRPPTCDAALGRVHAQRVTKNHVTMKCYGLGLGLDTFRMVALDANFRKLEETQVAASYSRCARACVPACVPGW